MPSGGRGAATTIPEEPVRAARQGFSVGSQPINMVDPQLVDSIAFWHYRHLSTQATAAPVSAGHDLLWYYSQWRIPGVVWKSGNEETWPFEVVEIGEPCASGSPVPTRYADSSTSLEKQDAADEAITDHFYSLLQAVLDLGAGEVFEDGMETEFSEELIEYLEAGRSSAVHALRRLLGQGYAGQEVGGEALRWLGCINQPATRNVRRLALEHYLQSDSAYLRDGAAIGLSEMDDPAALPAIGVAVSKGTSPLTLKRLRQLQEQLEATRSCHTSPG